MFTADAVINAYARNLFFLKELTADFTHADSLRQPPVRGNCANWIVGHIAAYRNRILTILDQEPTLDPAIATRYARDSAPVLGDEPAIGQFDTLMAAIEAAQPRIATGIQRMTPEAAARIFSYPPMTMPATDWMVFLLRHEAYHTGQLE
jgi:uncharacterized damage-inducible protein DinB